MTDYSEYDPAPDQVAGDARAEQEAAAIAQTAPEEAEPQLEESGTAPLQEQLEQAQKECAAANDRYLRTLAEMENFKKRLERTSSEQVHRARKDLLTKLLAVKDNLERALEYGGSSQAGEGIMEGVRLTQYQLDQLLAQEGVRPIEAQGKPFDPRTEEAIQSVHDAAVPDHTVTQVVRTGYTYHDQVLRPAQVIVSVHDSE